MNEPKIAENDTTKTQALTSMAAGLEKLIGHKLTSAELAAQKQKLSSLADEKENLEDLFTNYVELVNTWGLEVRGPAIAELVQHVQAALRGFIPTGDGTVDEGLGVLIGKLAEIEKTTTGRLAGTPEQWQVLHNVLKETQAMVDVISQSPKVNGKALESAYSHVIDAMTIVNPNASSALSSLEIRIETSESTKPALF